MNSNTLLHRQIEPAHYTPQTDHVASIAFLPMPKDDGLTSVDNGDKVSAEESCKNFLLRGHRSVGVLSVLMEECNNLTLSVRDDPIPDDPNHALIDFTGQPTGSSRKKIAKKLLMYAQSRGWGYKVEGKRE